MTDDLRDVKRRFRWARDKLDAVDAERQRFLAEDPYSIVRELKPDSGEKIWRIEHRLPAPLPLRLLIGEFVHHLRSGLDNLVWVLASANTDGRPYEGTQLVITRSPDKFKSERRDRLRSLPSGVKDAIETLQPYEGGEAPAPDENALWILNRLWNQDKHRALVLVGRVIPEKLNFALLEDVDIPAGEEVSLFPGILPMGTADDPHVIARVKPGDFAYDIDVEITAAFDVAFDRSEIWGGRMVMELLARLHKAVCHHVVPRICDAAGVDWNALTPHG